MFGGEKDPAPRELWVGWVVPAILVLIVTANLWSGRAYWPERSNPNLLTAYSDPLRFWSLVTCKLSLALGVFSWHVLANHARFERKAGPTALVAMIAVALAFLAFLYGLVR